MVKILCNCPHWPIDGHGDALPMSYCMDISHNPVFTLFCSKIGPKLIPYLQKYLTTNHAMLYTKQNQPLMALTTPNGFQIDPHMKKIRGVPKVPLGLKHPVRSNPLNGSTVGPAKN